MAIWSGWSKFSCLSSNSSIDSLIESDVGDLHGAENAADLLLNRGAGIFQSDWSDVSWLEKIRDFFVCEIHRKELISQWSSIKFHHIARHYSTRRPQCTMPPVFDNIHQGKIRPYTDGTRKKLYLTKRQARTILKEKHFLLHPGIRKWT